jgi:hypothetical protein
VYGVECGWGFQVRRQELECECIGLVTYLSTLVFVVDIRNVLSRANVTFEIGLSRYITYSGKTHNVFSCLFLEHGRRVERPTLKSGSAACGLRVHSVHICQVTVRGECEI